ncbi:hypothetical protein [uncultured Oscillibacter sp.]|uniref:hypothetical protein n=1 Tax=uncultured Oscillibacter sp. TaxID=876091 RepID=UPI002619C610|nr:hypothetical protein [uncultured Oscillibacter sp.]
MTVPYKNAPWGQGLYLSAMALDAKGSVKYYGAVTRLEAPAGEAVLDCPLCKGEVLLFVERRNGAKRTDFAGAPVPLREA